MNPLQFRLFPVDDESRLYISPAISDWTVLDTSSIRAVFDLEGGLDHGVPVIPNHTLYVYFPIFDEDLPDYVPGAFVLGPGDLDYGVFAVQARLTRRW